MKETSPVIGNESTLELVAGRHPNGELVVEKVLVHPLPENGHYQVLKSPLFVRGIARGDVIHLQTDSETKGQFSVVKHSGNLSIRLFSKDDFTSATLEPLQQHITSGLEKLGGDLDVSEARALVYSIHVSCGFNVIEKLLDEALSAFSDVVWMYGNVYDPESGKPIDWWQAILAPE